MWIFLPEGFFSIVAVYSDGGHGDLQPELLMIRARCRDHLVKFMEVHYVTAEIIESPHADYHYRIIVERRLVREVISRSVEMITYRNFKEEVSMRGATRSYLDALYAISAVTKRLQSWCSGDLEDDSGIC